MWYKYLKLKSGPIFRFTKNKPTNKVILLGISFFVFAFMYLVFCHDAEFGGINLLQDQLKKELVTNYVEKVKKQEISQYAEKKIAAKIKAGDVNPEKDKMLKHVVDPEAKNVDKQVTEKKLFQKFYDRFYFSVMTGTTVGYGDIYPVSNKVKFFTMVQVMATIYILVS